MRNDCIRRLLVVPFCIYTCTGKRMRGSPYMKNKETTATPETTLSSKENLMS